MSGTAWRLSGEYMESCNCDYLCPCIFTNPQAEVTHDHCTAALIFRIDQGHSGGVNLDGLCFALVLRSGKVMADGNWIFAPANRRLALARASALNVTGFGLSLSMTAKGNNGHFAPFSWAA